MCLYDVVSETTGCTLKTAANTTIEYVCMLLFQRLLR